MWSLDVRSQVCHCCFGIFPKPTCLRRGVLSEIDDAALGNIPAKRTVHARKEPLGVGDFHASAWLLFLRSVNVFCVRVFGQSHYVHSDFRCMNAGMASAISMWLLQSSHRFRDRNGLQTETGNGKRLRTSNIVEAEVGC